jgi:hypothetical protein
MVSAETMKDHPYYLQVFPPLLTLLLLLASRTVWNQRVIVEGWLPDFEVRVQKDGQAVHGPQRVISLQKISKATPLSDNVDGQQNLKVSIPRSPIPLHSFVAVAAVLPTRSGLIAPSARNAKLDDGPRGVFTLATDGAPRKPVSEDIFAKARLNGSVRVIVQLRIPVGPDETREQRIHAAQQGLLKELVATAHRVVRSFTSFPAIALEASHDALQVLNLSFHVLRVDEDELAGPLIKPSLLRPSAGSVEATT